MQQKFTYLFRRLQGSSLGFQLFTVSRFGFLLLVSVFLARYFPDKVIVSQYELLLLAGGSFTFFWVSGLYDGFVVLFRSSKSDKHSSILLHTFLSALGFAAFSSLATWGLGYYFLQDKLAPELTTAYAIFLFFDVISMLLVYYLLVQQKNVWLIVYGGLIHLAYFLLLVIPLYKGYTLVDSFRLLAIFAGLKFLVLLLFAGKPMLAGRLKKAHWRALLRVSGPLMLAILLSQSAQYVDSYLVESWFSDQFAVFRYGAKELPLVLLLANSLSLVRSGDIAAGLGESDANAAMQRLKQSSLRLIHGLFPISILLLLVSEPLFNWVLGPGFLGAVPVFDIYLLLVIPRLLFPQSVIKGHQRMMAMTYSAGIELVLNVGLSLLLMQYWGIAGIAMATVIAYFVEKIVLVVYCRRFMKLEITSYTPVYAWLGWSVVIAAAMLLKYTLF